MLVELPERHLVITLRLKPFLDYSYYLAGVLRAHRICAEPWIVRQLGAFHRAAQVGPLMVERYHKNVTITAFEDAARSDHVMMAAAASRLNRSSAQTVRL